MKKIIFLLLVVILAGCQERLAKTEVTEEMVGTTVTITVYNDNEREAVKIIELAFEEIKRIDNLLSSYKNQSEVSILNKEGFIDYPSNDLIYNVKKSLRYSELSQGAFDITVQPILDLYRDSFENKERAPTSKEIEWNLGIVNFENIVIQAKRISFEDHGMKITLGGIAKGYVIDKAINVLINEGINHALVNAGGDIRAIGNKGRKNWSIALANPRNEREYVAMIELNNNSVATSGDYERYFDDDKKFHHIVDPRTGYSATELISVTIITGKAVDADAIATAVFVLGPDEGLEFIEKFTDVEGLLITKEKEIIKSSGFDY